MARFALSGCGGAAGMPEYAAGKPGAGDPKAGCAADACAAPAAAGGAIDALPNGGTSAWAADGACSGAPASFPGATNGLSLLMIPPRDKPVDPMNQDATVSRSGGGVSIRFVRTAQCPVRRGLRPQSPVHQVQQREAEQRDADEAVDREERAVEAG